MAKIIKYIGFNPLPVDTLGQRIKAKRLELGLHQRELAERLGVNISTLKLWELDDMCQQNISEPWPSSSDPACSTVERLRPIPCHMVSDLSLLPKAEQN